MIDVAVFGAGRIGKIHAGNVARHPNARLRCVVDVNDAAARELATAHGASVASVDEVMNDASIGAVVIGSSTDTHADLMQRAAAAGKAIFCEKPVDLDLERARACAAAVEKAGVVCMIGFQRRFDPTFSALKARLVAGEIGTPEVLVVTSRDPGAPPVSYIKSSGGIFKDMLIHDFDIFRWILDDQAISIHATGSCLSDPAIAEAGDIDTTAVTIRTKSGRLCQINTSRRAAYGYDQRFEVLGSEGMLQAGHVKPTEVTAFTGKAISTDLPEHFFLQRYREAYALEIAHFFDALTEGTPVRTTIADGIRALELAELAARSWKEGRALECAV
ncbi:myo-inositol 2-dehydrogenase/D-chiro-inositol 1-dehydrogenase [Luteibacter sp. Sphag1AF]|uniref:inositol 2-dehydrogenase n=1 Tax=Luteibacter sp. Sphag1AF TaxID=2587031 RepID=UPI001619CED3|nr:inositol 2-dehydrogenase [Luteibacter sp. Sphag1AF]MBB3225983.1 myo-inositol 2-dehydrogenase/D-chiro-inositol 1-dehydrogenase [Luteibacter sp. Sphag1AF]